MDSTRAPVPSGQQRLGAHNFIASQRPHKLAALQALTFGVVVTVLIVVAQAQPLPAKVLEHRPAGRPVAGAQGVLTLKPDVWGGNPSIITGTAAAIFTSGGRPGTAFSQYVKTTKTARLFRLGCAEGERLRASTDPDGAIVVWTSGGQPRRERVADTTGGLPCSEGDFTRRRRSVGPHRPTPREPGSA